MDLSTGVADASVGEAVAYGLCVGDVLVGHAAIGLGVKESGLVAAAGLLELTLGEDQFRHEYMGGCA